jgi:NADH:ubiquinone oxidoreductase subunit 3 (subunit A)
MEENTNVTVAPAPQQPTNTVPWNYKPISPWGYVGYQLLFCVPVVGFVFMLVWAFSNNNINRKNFARSYLIFVIAGVILTIITVIIMAILGIGLMSFSTSASGFDYSSFKY